MARKKKTTVAKELRKIAHKNRKTLERLSIELVQAESEESRSEIILEIERIGRWHLDVRAGRRAEAARKSGQASRIKKLNKKSGLLNRKKKVSGGGGPGTGNRR